ncbi:uncharacterized protein LOC6731572 [Drosophila simulans]|uniref:Uncharacterized protein n=1 Tax=Drosophila simulans TaxID=7240 RepID=A0A0J9QYZ1_DROSI|nr:uncharacterized protein LOC6731572 [Drosophila simulans]KMY89158.1 uncharacterized protein Dsimw501_GD23570 [Drosophila simulans]
MPCCPHGRVELEEEADEVQLVFARTVYIEAGLLCSASAFPLLFVASLRLSVVKVLPIPPYVWLLFALAILAVLICLPIRSIRPLIVWAMVGGVVGLLTLSAAYYVSMYDIPDLVLYFTVMTLVVGGLMFSGAKCRKSFLPNGLVTGVIVTIFLVALLPLSVLSVVSTRYYFASFCAVLSALVLIVIPLETQFMHGRLQYSPLGLEPICSMLIYLNSFTLFFCICVFSNTIEGEILGSMQVDLDGLSTIPM